MKKTLINFLRKLSSLPVTIINRWRGSKIEPSTRCCKGCYLSKCNIGKYGYIGMSTFMANVNMGNYCSVAGFVTMGAMEHPYNEFSTSAKLFSEQCVMDKKTEIGHDVWIGTHVVVRQGIKIGTGAVVGANSFVNKDVPPYAIVFGSPAKIYKYRFDENTISKLLTSEFWNYEPDKAKKILEEINK